jgi:hypothetical protein
MAPTSLDDTSQDDLDEVEREARGRLLRSLGEVEGRRRELVRRGEHVAKVVAVASTIAFGVVAARALIGAILGRTASHRARLAALQRAWHHPRDLARPPSRGVLVPIMATAIATYSWLHAERRR